MTCYKAQEWLETIEWDDSEKTSEALATICEALQEYPKYRALGTVEELKGNKDFLEFLYNKIQPNEMEQYLQMYNAKDTKTVTTEGYADQCGLMSAT